MTDQQMSSSPSPNSDHSDADARHQAMVDFLDGVFDQYRIESLAGDASFRHYHRIYASDGSYLLMDAPPDKERVDHFVGVATVLSQAVNVPKIIAKDMAEGFLLLQDFGSTEFAQAILDADAKPKLYRQALQELAKIASLDPETQRTAEDWYIEDYSDAKLLEEMMLFWQWFLPYVGVTMEEALWQQVIEVVVQGVQSQPKVIVHRDYHSRNLMVFNDQLGIIDFQDALVGADTYDLVSLLRDAYIDESDAWVEAHIKQYHQLAGITRTLDQFVKDVCIMGVQRHLKVLGIFVRLYQRDGKSRYLGNLAKVLQDLMTQTAWLAVHDTPNQVLWQDFLHFLQVQLHPNFVALGLNQANPPTLLKDSKAP